MPASLARRTNRSKKASHTISGAVVPPMGRWKLEDAKARLSEVVRRAESVGPQLVTVRGREAAVIIAPKEYIQLLPKPKEHLPLDQFLRGLGLSALDVERELDRGREIEL